MNVQSINDSIRTEDIQATGMELPEEVNANEKLCEVLEKIRGTAAWTKSKHHP